MEINIRSLETMDDTEAIVEVQRQAWNMEDIGIVPTFETKAVSEVGFVYVAEHSSEIIGFIYGYHHFPDIHYSHMMAVLPEYHGQSVGYRLKKYHREQILKSAQRISSVQWTVDPLLPNNAYLNFTKLGGYCDTYKVNYYGNPDSDGVEIYAGVPTDRFKLTWPIHSHKVKKRMQNYRANQLDFAEVSEYAILLNKIKQLRYRGKTSIPDNRKDFLVEVPSNYQYVRRNHLDIAIDWRKKFREICVTALNSDYIVADYYSINPNRSERRNYYLFTQSDEFDGI